MILIRKIYSDSIRMKILFYLYNYVDTKRYDFISIYTEHIDKACKLLFCSYLMTNLSNNI